MARIFKTPFGAQGDTEQVPEAPQGDGSVSLSQGFGYDYEREYEDPAAKDIRREVMNGLFHDITEAVGDIQLSGIAKWSADAAPYPAGAVVWHSSAAWVSTAGNNSSEPGTGADWSAVDLSSSIRLSETIDQVPSANNVQEALEAIGALYSNQQFAAYSPNRTYATGEIVRGSNGEFYEFYDRDQTGEVQGVDPTNSANRPHIWMEWDGVRPATVIEWRSETLPEGYIENDGSEISRSDYRRVFAAFGTTYGAGDGTTTFLLPDDRGEFKRGWDNGRGVDPGRGIAEHQMDQMQQITGNISSLSAGANQGTFTIGGGAITASGDPLPTINGTNASGERQPRLDFDSANSPGARTGESTYPRNNAVIWLTKI